MFKSLAAGAVFASMFAASSAQACRYQIDHLAKGNELGTNALSNLRVSLNDVTNVSVTEFRYFESISTPMCPEELTYEARIGINWMDPTTLVPTRCAAELKVVKKEPWGKRRNEHQDEFTFTVINPTVCVSDPQD